MAELTSQDRLQPSLLDRLIDHEPQSRKESAEARAQLRAAVLRDLSWLFNATRPEPEPQSDDTEELQRWRQAEEARCSVINFGLVIVLEARPVYTYLSAQAFGDATDPLEMVLGFGLAVVVCGVATLVPIETAVRRLERGES